MNNVQNCDGYIKILWSQNTDLKYVSYFLQISNTHHILHGYVLMTPTLCHVPSELSANRNEGWFHLHVAYELNFSNRELQGTESS
jgi:hypothetical protein